MNYFKLAWRNIWRNKRRTLITSASLFSAVFFAVIMRSIEFGSYNMMIDNAVRTYSGYLQIQQKDYFKDKTIDDLMPNDETLNKKLMDVQGISSLLPRFESGAMASNGINSKVVLIQAIKPEEDCKLSKINERLVKGKFIDSHDSGILVSAGLASYLKLTVGDSLVLISQGYQGQSASGNYKIEGIIKMPIAQLDNRLIICNITTAQTFFGAENMLTSLILNLKDGKNYPEIQNEVQNLIDTNNLRVMNWVEMNKEMKQQIDSDNASGLIMLFILYTVIFFGVLGTIIMMTAERSKEFAVMVAIGMKRKRLRILFFLESIYMGIIGIIFGLMGSFPVVYYYYLHPVKLTGNMAKTMEQYGMQPLMPFSLDIWIFINQFFVVIILLLIATLYPLMKISNFKLINGLRS